MKPNKSVSPLSVIKASVINKKLSQLKNPGCLGYIGDYTTQLYREYSKPIIFESLFNQPGFNMESGSFGVSPGRSTSNGIGVSGFTWLWQDYLCTTVGSNAWRSEDG